MEFHLNQIKQVVQKNLLPKVGPGKIFLVKGPLGAGKTTIANVLAKMIGVKERITSPTFAYVNIYQLPEQLFGIEKFIHFDLYRLESFEEFVNLGLPDLLVQAHSFCLIEWPELLEKNLEPLVAKDSFVRMSLAHSLKAIDLRILEI
jgi:tRNA threonylcarbamoyladenosine biosynthesis protein TsaE